MRAVIWLAGISTLTWCSAWWAPYHRFKSFTSMMVDIELSPIYFFSLRPTRVAARLISSVSSIRIVAMAKATLVSPRSLYI